MIQCPCHAALVTLLVLILVKPLTTFTHIFLITLFVPVCIFFFLMPSYLWSCKWEWEKSLQTVSSIFATLYFVKLLLPYFHLNSRSTSSFVNLCADVIIAFRMLMHIRTSQHFMYLYIVSLYCFGGSIVIL